MIDHLGIEVADLARSAVFYDALFFAIGVRRMHESEHAIAYGVTAPTFWIVTRGRPPAPGYGHVAFRAAGRVAVDGAYAAALANGGRGDGEPGLRPRYGPLYYAAYLLDPDGLRVEVVANSG
ncbi:MAG TPA: VOC family protein [Solirubrobacteraceae bacterium]|jgi:catechol 2,3-dioxygenase-like lactoylglutathione lyase family enzyme